MFLIIPLFDASEVIPWGSPSQEDSKRVRNSAFLWKTQKTIMGEKKHLDAAERMEWRELNYLLFSREILEKIQLEVKVLEIDSFLMSPNFLASPPITPVWRCSKLLLKRMQQVSVQSGSRTKRSQPSTLALPSHIPASPTLSVPNGLSLLSIYLEFPPARFKKCSYKLLVLDPIRLLMTPCLSRLRLAPLIYASFLYETVPLFYPIYTL